MKVQIYTREGKVTSVRTNLPKDKTDEELRTTLEEYNEKHKEDGIACHLLDLDPLMSEVIKFFLGEREYKTQREMSDIYESLEQAGKFIRDLRDNLDNIKDEVEMTMEDLETTLKDLEKFKDED